MTFLDSFTFGFGSWLGVKTADLVWDLGVIALILIGAGFFLWWVRGK